MAKKVTNPHSYSFSDMALESYRLLICRAASLPGVNIFSLLWFYVLFSVLINNYVDRWWFSGPCSTLCASTRLMTRLLSTFFLLKGKRCPTSSLSSFRTLSQTLPVKVTLPPCAANCPNPQKSKTICALIYNHCNGARLSRHQPTTAVIGFLSMSLF
jgi:hypothetical protein